MDAKVRLSARGPVGNGSATSSTSTTTTIMPAARPQASTSDTEASSEWNFYSSSQNLVSVLHDPSVPRSYSDQILTRDWGSYFVDTASIPSSVVFPNVERSAFELYVRQKRKRDKLVRKLALITQSKASSKKQSPSKSLSHVPEIFLQNDFNLEDVDTFNAVFGLNQSNSDSFLTKNSLVTTQKRLSDYLDATEDNLSSQISLKAR